ncbi:MAG: insulin-like growth factor binding protein [Monoraphidium minutum]|nr:MAG: insulin-like growth factor binding protein [Monoraphidium minutum]
MALITRAAPRAALVAALLALLASGAAAAPCTVTACPNAQCNGNQCTQCTSGFYLMNTATPNTCTQPVPLGPGSVGCHNIAAWPGVQTLNTGGSNFANRAACRAWALSRNLAFYGVTAANNKICYGGNTNPTTATTPSTECTATCGGTGITEICGGSTATIYTLYETVVASCSPGWFNNANVCTPCGGNCSTCNVAATCLTCSGTFALSGSACVDTCPPGSYKNGNQCLQCTAPCATCSNTATTCTSCSGTFALSGSACVDTCPPSSYKNGNQCLQCTAPCASCSNTATTCTSCSSGALSLSGNTCGACTGATYNAGGFCTGCGTNCNVCDAAGCTQCADGFLRYNGTCVAPCPDRTFNNGAGACDDCPVGCAACTNANTCSSCLDTTSYVLITLGIRRTCTATSTGADPCAPAGYNNNGECADCGPTCGTCTNGTTCASCADGEQLQPGTGTCGCVPGYGGNNCNECAIGTFSPGGDGVACTSSCVPGRGGATCRACSAGTWSAGVDALRPSCTRCDTGKTTFVQGATSAASCTGCAAGYGGGSCAACGPGKFSSGGSLSLQKPTCQECPTGTYHLFQTAATSMSCTYCKPGYGGSTCAICGVGWYGIGPSTARLREPCVRCTSPLTSLAGSISTSTGRRKTMFL